MCVFFLAETCVYFCYFQRTAKFAGVQCVQWKRAYWEHWVDAWKGVLLTLTVRGVLSAVLSTGVLCSYILPFKPCCEWELLM